MGDRPDPDRPGGVDRRGEPVVRRLRPRPHGLRPGGDQLAADHRRPCVRPGRRRGTALRPRVRGGHLGGQRRHPDRPVPGRVPRGGQCRRARPGRTGLVHELRGLGQRLRERGRRGEHLLQPLRRQRVPRSDVRPGPVPRRSRLERHLVRGSPGGREDRPAGPRAEAAAQAGGPAAARRTGPGPAALPGHHRHRLTTVTDRPPRPAASRGSHPPGHRGSARPASDGPARPATPRRSRAARDVRPGRRARCAGGRSRRPTG